MSKKFLDDAYNLNSAQDTQDLYQDWAASYDNEVAENGYATPRRVAAALWAHMPEPQTPILDYGCGTGLSGLALHEVGFRVLDGMDPTPKMLERAEAKGIYRTLTGFAIDDPAPLQKGVYSVIAAIGVIGTGAAPPETFDLLMNALPKAGALAFSFNDHTLDDPAFTSRLTDWVNTGAARIVFRETGPHLPRQNLNSDVILLEKA